MRIVPLLTLAAAVSVAAVGVAEAQQRRGPQRLEVQKRSFLDPGTVVKPGSRPYLNYAFPMGYNFPTFSGSGAGPGPITGLRQPLPGPFDLPGF